MKIAIPARDGRVDDHFGHCDHYEIFTIEGGSVVAREVLASPQGCGCRSNIAAELASQGVGVMLAGNMGDGALHKLQEHGIRVLRGCSGEVEALVRSYMLGFVFDAGHSCNHECHSHKA